MDRLQRKMVRRIIGWRRIPGEEWKDTMRRMKCRVEYAKNLHNFEDWSQKYARNLWNYALHLSTGHPHKWARLKSIELQSMKSDPYAVYVPNRDVGRPKARWDDLLSNFFLGLYPDESEVHWLHHMTMINAKDFESSFVAYVCN